MVKISCPCPHETGVVKDSNRTVPDWHPLSREMIKELLDMAAQEGKSEMHHLIGRRLKKGVMGRMCPYIPDSPAFEKEDLVTAIYEAAYTLGGIEPLVDLFDSLLNWQKTSTVTPGETRGVAN